MFQKAHPKATPIMARMARKESQKEKEKTKEKENQIPLAIVPMLPVMPVARANQIKHRQTKKQQRPRKQQPFLHTIPPTNSGHGLMTMAGGHPNGMKDGMSVILTIQV